MKLPRLTTVVLLSGALALAAVISVQVAFRYEQISAITPSQVKIVLKHLRQNLTAAKQTALPPALAPIADDKIPLVLTVWTKEKGRIGVFQTDESPLKEAVATLQGKLAGMGAALDDTRLRLQLDAVIARGWIPQTGLLAVLAFVEGHDGISGSVAGQRVYLPPSELIRQGKYGTFKPLPGYDPKFRIGVDIQQTKKTIVHQGKRIGVRGDAARDLARFRALTVVEGENLEPRRLLKGTVQRPALNRARVHAAVLAGADYLVRTLGTQGIFRYYYKPLWNKDIPEAYNWPRHAGVSYSLALTGRLLHREDYLEAARRALEKFEKTLKNGPGGSQCLFARGRCYLGSSALGLLSLAEYRIASGDNRFDEISTNLARFLLSMARPEGYFFHDWRPKRGIDRTLMKLYASQQAILALARYAKAQGDDKAREAAIRGMDYLSGPYWSHFLGNFFFGQEHWSCLAAEEVYAAEPKDEYARFCFDIGRHYDNVSHNENETPFAEDVGGMSITHFFTPHLGGTATGAEAMVSAAALGEAIQLDTTPLRDQLRATFGFLIANQVTAHDTFWIQHPRDAIGGFYETQTKPRIRIDNVQHAISAMVRGMHLVAEDPQVSLDVALHDYNINENTD